MKRLIIFSAAVLFLTGCATKNYQLYAETQKAIAIADKEAQIARAEALKSIAASGDSAAKIAAVMSLHLSSQQQPQQQIAPPKSAGDTALSWASILIPSLTQFYSIGKSADIAIVNSNNNKDVAINNNEMVVDLVKGRKEPIIGTTDQVLLYPN